jgi:hypothetical protein
MLVRHARSLYLKTSARTGIVGFLLPGASAPPSPSPCRLVRLRRRATTIAVRRRDRVPDRRRSRLDGADGRHDRRRLRSRCRKPATLPSGAWSCGCAEHTPPPQRSRYALVIAGASLLTGVEVNRSQAAARSGHLAAAREHAVAATRLEPWAATPRLQLALVEESAGDLAAARRTITAAISRDPENWQLWLVASRVENRLGRTAESARSKARARALNPRSSLLAPGS